MDPLISLHFRFPNRMPGFGIHLYPRFYPQLFHSEIHLQTLRGRYSSIAVSQNEESWGFDVGEGMHRRYFMHLLDIVNSPAFDYTPMI